MREDGFLVILVPRRVTKSAQSVILSAITLVFGAKSTKVVKR